MNMLSPAPRAREIRYSAPSSQPEVAGARVIGVVEQTPSGPEVTYLEKPVAATADVLAMSAPFHPTEVFRLAAACQTDLCPHFDGANCGLATGIRGNDAGSGGPTSGVQNPPGMSLVPARGRRSLPPLPADLDSQLQRVGDNANRRQSGARPNPNRQPSLGSWRSGDSPPLIARIACGKVIRSCAFDLC